MRFDFATATEVVFGWGRASELGRRVSKWGRCALFVTGSRPARVDRIRDELQSAGIETVNYAVASEPTTTLVRTGVTLARSSGVDLVVGVGGGSVLDAAKAIAVLVPQTGDIYEYLEVVGQAQPLSLAGLPCVAVPTTAGTGSEVTRNAVLVVEERAVKVSLRGLNVLPRLALVDPELTLTVPPDITAATGLDALTQVIEPYLSVARGPLTDALCLEGIRRAARSIRTAYRDSSDRSAREDLALTSLFGGLALANAKLGAVHGFAAPLGGVCHAPHGAICARLLPLVVQTNLMVVGEAEDRELVERFENIARIITGRGDAVAHDAVTWLAELVEDLQIPRLKRYGVGPEQIEAIVAQAAQASSMQGNPVKLPMSTLSSILYQAL